MIAVLIVCVVRFGLMAGIELFTSRAGWSPKRRGHALGLAAATPELICLVAATLAGVWEVGLWAIAVSSWTNVVVMVASMVRHGRFGDFGRVELVDEWFFAIAAASAPLVLLAMGVDTHTLLIPVLLGFYALYWVVDLFANRAAIDAVFAPKTDEADSARPLVLGSLVLLLCLGAGIGYTASHVVDVNGSHPLFVGSVVGVLCGLPEVSLFLRQERDDIDIQQTLDGLAASNMTNVGLVYPVGVFVFLLVTLVLPV